ncbi:MAG: preprotein translocase subunit SecA, partial [Ruminococcaceae bacterium]|nr:preprotein translocase subunit SecA [Oscillospiraceae bacterium]
RIDNQLRGRSGRQGDVGESRFYLSLDDDLLRKFGSDRLRTMVDSLGLGDEDAIEAGMLSSAIERAQRTVEGNNFKARENVLKYDDVMNVQRKTIYAERNKVLDGGCFKQSFERRIDEFIALTVDQYIAGEQYPENWNITGLIEYLEQFFVPEGELSYSKQEIEDLTKEALIEDIRAIASKQYELKEEEFGEETLREIERIILLRAVDSKWMDHIDDMERLRQGIGLRAYAQRDPLLEYTEEGYIMYEAMLQAITEDIIRLLFHVRAQKPLEREQVAKPTAASGGSSDGTLEKKPVVRKEAKVGRNDPCPCGSGLKYKKCCGK